MADQIRRAFLEWLSIECSQQPMLLLLEDLHWADLATIQLLSAALQQLKHLPLLVLAFARPEAKERFPLLSQLHGIEEMVLRALPTASCKELIQSFLGAHLPPTKIQEMIELSQGNAFYLEELIRALNEGRTEQLPASIIAIAQARIDSLPEASRHLLRAASVFGESFVLPSLLPMLSGVVAEHELRQQLSWLWNQEVLTRSPSQADRYHFRHALVRDAAYAKLTKQDRSLAHRLAAQWLETQEHPEAFTLAEHWRQGEEPTLAAHWYAIAAKVSLEGNDLHAALRLADLAFQLGVSTEHLNRLYTIKAEAFGWLGQPLLALSAWQELLNSSPDGSPSWYNALAGLFMANLQLRDFGKALEQIQRLQDMTPQAEAATDSAMALTIVTSFSCVGGLYSVASTFIEKFETFPTAKTEAEQWILLGWKNQAYAYGALYLQGEPWEYLQRAQTAMRYFEKTGHLRGALAQAVEVGRAYMNLGAFSQAERLLREKLSQLSLLQIQYLIPFARLFLGQSLRCQQQYSEANLLIEEALIEFAKNGHGPKQGDSRAELGKILLEQNNLTAAHAQLRQALPLLAFAPPAKSKAIAILSLIRLSQDNPSEALQLSQEALDLLDSLGGRGYEDIYLYWARVEALLANQKTTEAKDLLYEAKRRLLLRADHIPEPTYRESFLSTVEENRKILALAQQFRL
jgi:eukaryotic-like serine/threonine-protein kinase